jgi:hypothetical protein
MATTYCLPVGAYSIKLHTMGHYVPQRMGAGKENRYSIKVPVGKCRGSKQIRREIHPLVF